MPNATGAMMRAMLRTDLEQSFRMIQITCPSHSAALASAHDWRLHDVDCMALERARTTLSSCRFEKDTLGQGLMASI
jgi:hypothetical protein